MGKPIIAYAIEAALNSKLFDEVMVSTDSEEIAQVSRKWGAKVPFMRSAKTSDDHANTIDALAEVIEEYKKMDKREVCLIRGQNVGPQRSFLELIRIADKAMYYFFSDQDDIWYPDKIKNAVKKSATRMLVTLSDEELDRICDFVDTNIAKAGKTEIQIYEMHNIVEGALEAINPSVAQSYRNYRNYKQDFVHMLDKVYQESQRIMYIGDKENSNADSTLVSTKRSLIFNELNKELYKKFFLTVEDRQAIKESNVSITGDKYYSLDNGPVLSGLYDLIKGTYPDSASQNLWNIRFAKDGYNIVLLTDRLPFSKLSDFEKSILDEIDTRYKDASYSEMIDIVHDSAVCPEWQNPYGSRIEIEKKTILEKLGRTPEEIDFILSEDSYYENEEQQLKALANG